MATYEQKIIKGIAEGVIKPSEIALAQSEFANHELGMMFTASQRLEADSLPIDLDGLFNFTTKLYPDDFWLGKRVFESEFFGELSKSVIYQAINNVKNNASRETLVKRIRAIADSLEDKKTSQILGQLKSVIEEAENTLTAQDNGFVFIADLVEKNLKVYQDLHEGKSYAIPTYFPQIDNSILDGFSKGDLHLIAGQSGNGKSALMLNFAKNQAKHGYCVGIVSLEMSDVENVIRLQSSDAQIPRYHIRKDLHQADLDILTANLHELAKLKIALNTVTGDIYYLPIAVREMVEQYGLDILYVDYAQLYTASNHSKTKAGEVDYISKCLKSIAMENNIPVVALTQFAKSALNASMFELSDHFKESSSLKQDASTALVIQLEQTEELKQVKQAKTVVLKNRNGACFSPIDLEYHGSLFTFREKTNEVPQSYYERNA